MNQRKAALVSGSNALALPVVLIFLWVLLSRLCWIDSRFFPPPQSVLERRVAVFTRGDLMRDFLSSIVRNLLGGMAGGLLGFLFGLLVGASTTMERLVGPLLLFHRQVALFAWVPLLSAWLGGGDLGKCAFIAMAAFQPMLMNTWQGIRNMPQAYRELAQALTFNQYEFLRFIAIPAALPFIITGLRSALIYGWLATVGSELFMNIAPGIGARMNEGRDRFEMDLLLICLLLLGAFGFFLNASASLLQRRRYACS
jgi:sulfonate transport system permease protein